MLRNRLKNIINKSKELSKPTRDPFDLFVNSLPEGLDYYKGDNYRLKAAWKAYGSPKNYQEALWEGLIQPIDKNTFKMPSIGYNEENDSYEYLNKGKENDIVAKDIRVWDNDVIPFVKELKYGGYVRTFNEEENFWTYSKNIQKGELPSESNELQVSSFLKGGKSKRTIEQLVEFANNKKPPFIQRILNNDERVIPLIMEDGKKHYGTHLLSYGEKDGKTYVFPEILDIDGDLIRLNWPGNLDVAYDRGDVLEMTPEEAEEFTKNYKKYYPNFKPFYKNGGQMNVIPEGALHARKNNMELAKEGEVTSKGIPVVDNNGELQAEIEREEIIFSKDTTEKIECFYKSFKEEGISESKKDELAIKCGKFLTDLILNNTDDKTGLIEEVKLNM